MKRIRYEDGALDAADRRILALLAEDARLPVAEAARRVGLSAPAVGERIRRLEEAGVILGWRAEVSSAALGRPLEALLRVRPVPGELPRVAKILAETPQITRCDRVTGEDCFLARAALRSVQELETVIDRLIPYAMTNTSLIQSTPVPERLPPLTEA
ncbi:MAG: Lrp/AsnC family transcriptional regulator [Pseudomonadota bacterium]